MTGPRPRLFISASHKSSGKTTVSVGLAAALTRRGLIVQTFKKGPDYIDPMWLARASGRTCFNLDFNTQSPAEIVAMLEQRSQGADISLIEGNMGLHDGVDGEGADSSAALALLTGAPVVLVVDCQGMSRGVAALLMGFQSFDPRVRIAGVILNRVAGARQLAKLVAAIERYSSIPVLGALRRSSDLSILERHLGLTTPAEAEGAAERVEGLARAVEDQIDLDRIVAMAREAGPISSLARDADCLVSAAAPRLPGRPRAGSDVAIAIARDSAFGFYYADDLEALERAGARLVPFSPLEDTELPDVDGIFIGGGFPETHMEALERNAEMRSAIKRAASEGRAIYAECGGLMYLARSIRWGSLTCRMAGVIDADIVMHNRPQGSGLVKVAPTAAFPWPGGPQAAEHGDGIAAHEFHYAEMLNVPPGATFAWRVIRGHGIDGRHDGILVGNVMGSFTHLRDTAAHRWAGRFVDFVRETKARRAAGAVVRAASRSEQSAVIIEPISGGAR